MYGKLPVRRPAPRRTATVHRWSGTVAFLFTLPVAYHCLWSLGFAETGTRQIAHSIFGCAFYGAFATKMLVLRIDGLPALRAPDLRRSARDAAHGAVADVVAVVLHQRRVPVLTMT